MGKQVEKRVVVDRLFPYMLSLLSVGVASVVAVLPNTKILTAGVPFPPVVSPTSVGELILFVEY